MILAGTYLLGSISFIIFGTGELQSWNNPDPIDDQEAGIPLKEKEKNGHNGTSNGKSEALTS